MSGGSTATATQPESQGGQKPGFFTRNQDVFRAWTASISSIAQVLAVVIAGIWTYRNFAQSQKPSLEPHLSTSADVTWSSLPDKRSCAANLDVTLENTGKAPVEVTEVEIRGWITDVPSGGNLIRPRLYTDEEVKKGELFFDQKSKSGYLLGHFPPGVKSEDSFTFLFKNQPKKATMWEVEFSTAEHLKYPSKASVFDTVCNYESN